MKKILRYIFLMSILLSFCTILNAEDDYSSLNCKYNYSKTGATTGGETLNFKVYQSAGRFVLGLNGKTISPIYSNDKNEDANFVVYNNVYYYVSNISTDMAVYDYNIDSEGCPTLYMIEENRTIPYSSLGNTKVNVRKLCSYSLGQCAGGVTLVPLDSNGNAKVSDTTNINDKTVYTFSKASALLFGMSADSSKYQANISITAFSDGKYYIKLDTNNGSYLDITNANRNGIIWSDASANTSWHTLAIRSTELEELKRNLPYDKNVDVSTDKKKLTIQAKKYGLSTIYLISVNGVSDADSEGEQAEVGYDMDADTAYRFLVNDQIKSFDSSRDTCTNLLSQEVASYLQTAYTLIKILSIILLIVFSMLDFAKTITKDKDELMKAVKKWVTRLIVLLIILMLPTFIDIIGDAIGYEDILCNIK